MKFTQQIALSAVLALSSVSYVYAHGIDNRNKAEVIHDDWMQDDDMPVTKASIMESKKNNNKVSNNEQEKLHDEWMRDDDMPITKGTMSQAKKQHNNQPANEKIHDEWMRDDDMPIGQDQHKNHSHK